MRASSTLRLARRLMGSSRLQRLSARQRRAASLHAAFEPARRPVSTTTSQRHASHMAFAQEEPLHEDYTHHRHCKTCSCDQVDHEAAILTKEQTQSGYIADCGVHVDENEPLPPPLPEPKYSVRRRVMTDQLTALNSQLGRQYLLDALAQSTAAPYICLTEHYMNQSDPAFCGVTTLVMVLNALGVDPNVRWRGGWRYFGDETVLLEQCCLRRERVARVGITLQEFDRLARCQGLQSTMRRPDVTGAALDDFRRDVQTLLGGDTVEGILVVSFGRAGLGQTGDGHFSPLAAYHAATDQVLVLDVARFKYQPYWVKVDDLYAAMSLPDAVTKQSRGWYALRPRQGQGLTKQQGPIREEDRRPAHLVPERGSLCPMHPVKIDYCQNRSLEDADDDEAAAEADDRRR